MLEKNRKSPEKNKLAPSEIENRGASPIGQGQGPSRGASLVVVAARAWGARGRGHMLAGGWAAPCPDTLGWLACKVLSEFERKKPPIKPRHHKTSGAASAPTPIKHRGLVPYGTSLAIQHPLRGRRPERSEVRHEIRLLSSLSSWFCQGRTHQGRTDEFATCKGELMSSRSAN